MGLWFTGFKGIALVMEGEIMRLDYKLAVLKSGRHQFEVAHEAGLSEGRLSRFIRGREQLRPEEEQRLRTVLGLVTEAEEVHVG
jgi:hypothetical protein